MAEQGQSDRVVATWKIAKHKPVIWGVVAIDHLLLIAHLTLIYVVFLIAGNLVLVQIARSFGDFINQFEFVAALLQGMKVFTVLGTAIAYALHLIYSLYLQGRHAVKMLRDAEEAGGT